MVDLMWHVTTAVVCIYTEQMNEAMVVYKHHLFALICVITAHIHGLNSYTEKQSPMHRGQCLISLERIPPNRFVLCM